MTFTFYELVWFYFIYSLTGWCAEVCVAAARKKKFINRGFVSGPLCPIYGTGAVVFAVFLPELRENPFFLFIFFSTQMFIILSNLYAILYIVIIISISIIIP